MPAYYHNYTHRDAQYFPAELKKKKSVNTNYNPFSSSSFGIPEFSGTILSNACSDLKSQNLTALSFYAYWIFQHSSFPGY